MIPRAVFLDKDGTLLEDVPYNTDPSLMRLMPQAAEGLRMLHETGHKLAVISNQAGVARGRFPESALRRVEEGLRDLFASAGVPLAGFYYCPHDPAGCVERYAVSCVCRKPAPGLILQAARDLQVSPADSWMIGDILDDVEAGRSAGCRTVFLDNGHETEWLLTPGRRPHRTALDLADAAVLIRLQDQPQRRIFA